MRTDSTRISEEARNAAKRIYRKRIWEKHIMKIDTIKQKAMHKMHMKAIRPTYVELTPEK